MGAPWYRAEEHRGPEPLPASWRHPLKQEVGLPEPVSLNWPLSQWAQPEWSIPFQGHLGVQGPGRQQLPFRAAPSSGGAKAAQHLELGSVGLPSRLPTCYVDTNGNYMTQEGQVPVNAALSWKSTSEQVLGTLRAYSCHSNLKMETSSQVFKFLIKTLTRRSQNLWK